MLTLATPAEVCLTVGNTFACGGPHGDASGSLELWLVAVVSALVGAAIALVGQSIRDNRAAARRVRGRMAAIALELETIESEANERANVPDDGGVRRGPPLPKDAWTTLLSSPDLSRVDSDELTSLAGFYRAVDSANALASLAPTYLLIAYSTNASDAASVAYETEAVRVSTEPFATLAATVGEARRSAQRGLQ